MSEFCSSCAYTGPSQLVSNESIALTCSGPLSDVTAHTLNRRVVACNVDVGGSHECKRLRTVSLLHSSFPKERPPYVDRLQRLYSHARDEECYMDEKLHKYYVGGVPYSLSVSGWLKMFFEEFDPQRVSWKIVERHHITPGFRSFAGDFVTPDAIPEGILASSVYNFGQHVRVLEKRGNDEFLDLLRKVVKDAVADYSQRCVRVPFSLDHLMDLGQRFLKKPQKPDGPSCYYLMFLYTAALGLEQQAALLVQTWHVYGRLESLKGTYLHKKIELFINAMVIPMERERVSHMAVEDLLCDAPPEGEYSAMTVMHHIAWAQDTDLWDHPLAQDFFKREMISESVEFRMFLSWLSTKPRWSPFRLEWSLFNEDLMVAGQLDSLWMDLDNDREFVMADWKRTRQLLKNDVVNLQRQSFGKMGISCCSHLYDTPWSHYFVQQTLYAYMGKKSVTLGAYF